MKKVQVSEGLRLYKRGEYTKALEVFLHATPSNDNQRLMLFYYVGLCYTHKRMFGNALLYIQQVVDSHLGFAYVYQCRMILGYIYAVMGNYIQSEREFLSLTHEGYESAKIYAALAHIAYSRGQIDRSLQQLGQALALDPENSNALNSVGYILAEKNLDLERAYTCCKKAVQKQPNNPAYLDSLALVYYRMERLEEARAMLEKAIALSGSSVPEMQERLQVVKQGIKGK